MAGSADHPDRGHQTRHALTFNPDHPMGAGHLLLTSRWNFEVYEKELLLGRLNKIYFSALK